MNNSYHPTLNKWYKEYLVKQVKISIKIAIIFILLSFLAVILSFVLHIQWYYFSFLYFITLFVFLNLLFVKPLQKPIDKFFYTQISQQDFVKLNSEFSKSFNFVSINKNLNIHITESFLIINNVSVIPLRNIVEAKVLKKKSEDLIHGGHDIGTFILFFPITFFYSLWFMFMNEIHDRNYYLFIKFINKNGGEQVTTSRCYTYDVLKKIVSNINKIEIKSTEKLKFDYSHSFKNGEIHNRLLLWMKKNPRSGCALIFGISIPIMSCLLSVLYLIYYFIRSNLSS